MDLKAVMTITQTPEGLLFFGPITETPYGVSFVYLSSKGDRMTVISGYDNPTDAVSDILVRNINRVIDATYARYTLSDIFMSNGKRVFVV